MYVVIVDQAEWYSQTAASIFCKTDPSPPIYNIYDIIVCQSSGIPLYKDHSISDYFTESDRLNVYVRCLKCINVMMSFCSVKYDSILRKFSCFFYWLLRYLTVESIFQAWMERIWMIYFECLVARPPVWPQQRVNVNTPQHQPDLNSAASAGEQGHIFAWTFSIFSPPRAPPLQLTPLSQR